MNDKLILTDVREAANKGKLRSTQVVIYDEAHDILKDLNARTGQSLVNEQKTVFTITQSRKRRTRNFKVCSCKTLRLYQTGNPQLGKRYRQYIA